MSFVGFKRVANYSMMTVQRLGICVVAQPAQECRRTIDISEEKGECLDYEMLRDCSKVCRPGPAQWTDTVNRHGDRRSMDVLTCSMRVFAVSMAQYGRCDVLVHSAATFDVADLLHLEATLWRHVQAVNVESIL